MRSNSVHNALLDGALTLNGDVFSYDYRDYQILKSSTAASINLNFNATVKESELEASWEPVIRLKINFASGYGGVHELPDGAEFDRSDGSHGWNAGLDGHRAPCKSKPQTASFPTISYRRYLKNDGAGD